MCHPRRLALDAKLSGVRRYLSRLPHEKWRIATDAARAHIPRHTRRERIMATELYDLTVPAFLRGFSTLSKLLTAGEVWAKEAGIAEADMLDSEIGRASCRERVLCVV